MSLEPFLGNDFNEFRNNFKSSYRFICQSAPTDKSVASLSWGAFLGIYPDDILQSALQ